MTILRQLKKLKKPTVNPIVGSINVEESTMNITDWFDSKFYNLLLVQMQDMNNAQIVNEIGYFNTKFGLNSSMVGDMSTFITIHRLSEYLNLSNTTKNVPIVMKGDKLVSIHNELNAYYTYLQNQEENLTSIYNDIKNMPVEDNQNSIEKNIFKAQITEKLNHLVNNNTHPKIESINAYFKNYINNKNNIIKAAITGIQGLESYNQKAIHALTIQINNFEKSNSTTDSKYEILQFTKTLEKIFAGIIEYNITKINAEKFDKFGHICLDELSEMLKDVSKAINVMHYVNSEDIISIGMENLQTAIKFRSSLSLDVIPKILEQISDKSEHVLNIKVAIKNAINVINYLLDNISQLSFNIIELSNEKNFISTLHRDLQNGLVLSKHIDKEVKNFIVDSTDENQIFEVLSLIHKKKLNLNNESINIRLMIKTIFEIITNSNCYLAMQCHATDFTSFTEDIKILLDKLQRSLQENNMQLNPKRFNRY